MSFDSHSTWKEKNRFSVLFESFYNLFSTRSNIFLLQDDSTHLLLPKDVTFSSKDSYDHHHGFRRRLSSFGQSYGKETMRVIHRKRRIVLPYILLLLSCIIVCMLYVLIMPHDLDFSLSDFTLNAQVINSTCCSRRSNYLPFELDAIQAHQPFLDDEVLERWISNGEMHSKADFSKYKRIDGVTTWVNGSDPRHRANRIMFGEDEQKINEERLIMKSIKENKDGGSIYANNDAIQRSESRFRDMNELQYHVRATRQSLQEHLGTHHIISTDFWRGQKAEKGVQDDRFGHHHGQIPQWLNVNSPLVAFPTSSRFFSRIHTPAIRLHHDSQVFVPFDASTQIEQWKSQRLPTFNSMAVESVIGLNMPGLSQIYFLASDDMFIIPKMTIADFFTPLFGPVMQIMQNAYTKGGESSFSAPTSELASMEYSIGLLRDRFGTPGFGYITHLHKSIVQPLMEESRMIWREQFEKTNSKRFRGNGLMANSHLLTYGMIIERHREALLWSFLIARIDRDGDGMLNEEEMKAALQEIGASTISSNVHVRLPKRTTTDSNFQKSTFDQSKFPSPKVTNTIFSSFDGYAYAEPDLNFISETGKQFSDMPISMLPVQFEDEQQKKLFTTNFCTIQLSTCWPKDEQSKPITTTNTLFKRFAFEKRGCGDCLIMHLIGKSGERGLKAFLPSEDQEFPQEAIIKSRKLNKSKSVTKAYHLPLSTAFQAANFSLENVAIENRLGLRSVTTDLSSLPSLRSFAMHLFIRYSYSIGTAPGAFESLQTSKTVKEQLDRVRQQANSDMVFLCLNDDIVSGAQEIQIELNKFFEELWPSNRTRLPFEKTL